MSSRDERTWRCAWLFALLAMACGDVPEEGVTFAPPGSPERTAVQDRAIRALLMDVAEARTCEELRGRFVPLPEDRPASPTTEQPAIEGRLWISECRVERRGDHLAVHAAGQGWRWIDRSSPGPLGSSFTVRGHLRFQAAIDVELDVDLRYDERDHRALVAITPRREARARVTPIGAIPVSADGGWSGVIGGLGSLLGAPVEERARPLVEEQGAAMVRRQLQSGATFAFDLCTGQLDGALGALEDGAAPPARPYDDGDALWIDNARVLLRPDGLDLAGPFSSEGRRVLFDVEVEEGEGADVALICREQADLIASEYLSSGTLREGEELERRSAARARAVALALEPGECAQPVLYVRPSGDAPVRYRYRVRREGDAPTPWVRCR